MQQLAVQSLSGNVQLPAAAIIEALSLSRATHYRHKLSAAQPDPDIQLRDHIQRLALAWPYYGYRRITAELHRQGLQAKQNSQPIFSRSQDCW
jgi:hypothetical protein